MREMRGVLVKCADYRCGHSIPVRADSWPEHARLSDIEGRFVCSAWLAWQPHGLSVVRQSPDNQTVWGNARGTRIDGSYHEDRRKPAWSYLIENLVSYDRIHFHVVNNFRGC